MKVVFRADASLQIGSGHIMRCLTLAAKLAEKGWQSLFVCRPHDGHLIEHIASKGFQVFALSKNTPPKGDGKTGHQAWLGCDWQEDAEETKHILLKIEPDWVIVDHYALDGQWESVQRLAHCKIMVIDDLVDRQHDCDVLLDQTLNRKSSEYSGLTPAHTVLLCGTQYGLLRPEFVNLRKQSLERRLSTRGIQNILITMGGVDQFNATLTVLKTLNQLSFCSSFQVTVVLGGLSKNLPEIQDFKSRASFEITILTNVSNMAELMLRHDLAIGAAGSTSWERCCMGLPTAIVILAENQIDGADALVKENAAYVIGDIAKIESNLPKAIQYFSQPNVLQEMAKISSDLVDGLGAERVFSALESKNGAA